MCSDTHQGTISGSGSFTSHLITGLKPSSRYTITVRSFNEAGNGPASNEVMAMTNEIGKRPKQNLHPLFITVVLQFPLVLQLQLLLLLLLPAVSLSSGRMGHVLTVMEQ